MGEGWRRRKLDYDGEEGGGKGRRGRNYEMEEGWRGRRRVERDLVE